MCKKFCFITAQKYNFDQCDNCAKSLLRIKCGKQKIFTNVQKVFHRYHVLLNPSVCRAKGLKVLIGCENIFFSSKATLGG